MTPFKQLVQHNPPESIGDCFRTCIACLLDVEPASVPHFYDPVPEDHEARLQRYRDIKDYLRSQFGLDLLMLSAPGSEWLPRGLCIASGRSPRFADTLHAVVWRMTGDGVGELVHDPHPDGTGIVGEPTEYEFLVPINPAELRRAA